MTRSRGNVSHLKSLFTSDSIGERALPKRIKHDLTHFPKDQLQRVVTRVTNHLPSIEGVAEFRNLIVILLFCNPPPAKISKEKHRMVQLLMDFGELQDPYNLACI